jgi:hypothetical protein
VLLVIFAVSIVNMFPDSAAAWISAGFATVAFLVLHAGRRRDEEPLRQSNGAEPPR